jgi:hypothetical protein
VLVADIGRALPYNDEIGTITAFDEALTVEMKRGMFKSQSVMHNRTLLLREAGIKYVCGLRAHYIIYFERALKDGEAGKVVAYAVERRSIIGTLVGQSRTGCVHQRASPS